MPTPLLYDDEAYALLNNPEETEQEPFHGIPYITDRMPLNEEVGKSSKKARFYGNERSPVLRAGFGQIEYAGNGKDTKKARKRKQPIAVSSISELGLLKEPLPYGRLTDPTLFENEALVDEEFADLINQKIAQSEQKDIFIYVHGFKVLFDNPLLVSAELWHFMGFRGAFIAYTWPSTPRGLAYFKDTETAQLSGQNLRLTLEYLARHTNAERIHIIGYSAGTRVVITALHQLALINSDEDEASVREKCRIGRVALIGSDYDANQFGVTLSNGILKVPESLTVYASQYDDALGVSRLVFGQSRLGQTQDSDDVSEYVKRRLEEYENLAFVDVSKAVQSRTGEGHGYFRKSPWVSSDILMTMRHGLSAEERGLSAKDGKLLWEFPLDYVDRLEEAIKRL
ncbi:alpha/beta hydrolase [Puniceicoccaceae bacterium K14]|nr:alpha/beta hydrolase [Puniceicoccaceae bacterium K14]